MSFKTKFKAFTLAEVLIVVGIIGIIAELTIPALVADFNKKTTLVALQKAYTNLAQAVKLSEVDNGPNSTWSWTTAGDATYVTNAFNTYFAPYFKINKVCTGCTDCDYVPAATCWAYGLNGSTSMLLVSPPTRATVLLQDGTIMIVQMSTNEIAFDINGHKSPNIFGKDIFFFKLFPQGAMPKDYANAVNNCATGDTGISCAAKIIRDGWQIKDDYPWN